MKKIILVFLLGIAISSLNAQSVGGSLILGIPQSEFSDNVNNSAFGGIEGQITLATPGKANPFTIGLNASFMIYGIENREVPLSTTIPDVSVDVERRNSMANLHLLFQVSPFDGQIRPYLEGVVGGSYIWTETGVEGSSNIIEFASSVNHDDFAWSYGFGGGLLISLSDDLEELPGGLFLDIKTRYMFTSEAEYLATGDLSIVNNRLIYDTKTSRLEYLTIQIGVVVGL